MTGAVLPHLGPCATLSPTARAGRSCTISSPTRSSCIFGYRRRHGCCHSSATGLVLTPCWLLCRSALGRLARRRAVPHNGVPAGHSVEHCGANTCRILVHEVLHKLLDRSDWHHLPVAVVCVATRSLRPAPTLLALPNSPVGILFWKHAAGDHLRHTARVKLTVVLIAGW